MTEIHDGSLTGKQTSLAPPHPSFRSSCMLTMHFRGPVVSQLFDHLAASMHRAFASLVCNTWRVPVHECRRRYFEPQLLASPQPPSTALRQHQLL